MILALNVWKDLFAPTVPQIEFSNNYKIVQQKKSPNVVLAIWTASEVKYFHCYHAILV